MAQGTNKNEVKNCKQKAAFNPTAYKLVSK